MVPPEIHCQTLPRLFDARLSLPQRLVSDITVEVPTYAIKPPTITETSAYSTAQLSKDMHMVCSNAAQYIQQLTSQTPHPLLAPSPRFAPATIMAHAILSSNLTDTKDMPTDKFEKFLLTSHRECSRSDSGNKHHELYILFLFTQILRELMTHLAIKDSSDYFSTLNEIQMQLILDLTSCTTTTQDNFQFSHHLPNPDNWIPINAPSRARTWVMWPDVPDGSTKIYTDSGRSRMAEIPPNFEQHHFRGTNHLLHRHTHYGRHAMPNNRAGPSEDTLGSNPSHSPPRSTHSQRTKLICYTRC